MVVCVGVFVDSIQDLGQDKLDDLLREAILKNNLRDVQLLLEQGANIDAPNVKKIFAHGITALMYFIQRNSLEVVSFLLDKGVNIEAVDNDGDTALLHSIMRVCVHNNTQIFQLLLDKGAKINVKNRNGLTVIDYVTKHSKPELLKLLINKNLITQNELDSRLIKAMHENNPTKMQCLIEAGANIDETNVHGVSIFMRIVSADHINIVRMLIEKNKKLLNITDSFKITALMYAFQRINIEMIQLLIEMGADLEADSPGGYTVLISAAAYGYTSIVKLLLKKGANIDAQTDEGKTALMCSAERGYTGIMELLLNRGANIDVPNEDNLTVRDYIIAHGKLEMLKLLVKKNLITQNELDANLTKATIENKSTKMECFIKAGATIDEKNAEHVMIFMQIVTAGDIALVKAHIEKNKKIVEVENRHGETALMNAVSSNQYAMVKLLLMNGANVNKVFSDDKTLLMYASKEGYTGIVALLIQYGVNLNAINLRGMNALIYAAWAGHVSVVDFLLEAGSHEHRLRSLNKAVNNNKLPTAYRILCDLPLAERQLFSLNGFEFHQCIANFKKEVMNVFVQIKERIKCSFMLQVDPTKDCEFCKLPKEVSKYIKKLESRLHVQEFPDWSQHFVERFVTIAPYDVLCQTPPAMTFSYETQKRNAIDKAGDDDLNDFYRRCSNLTLN